MVLRGTLIKRGDDYVITVPSEEVARLNLREGQAVVLNMLPSEGGDLASSDQIDSPTEHDGWSRLVMRSLARDWDSEADRVYDNLS